MDWDPLRLTGRPPIEVPPPLPENSPTVIVDDEAEVLDVLCAHLREARYPVTAFQDPLLAMAFLGRERPAFLISDVAMPELRGTELARYALEEVPDLAVIILTGHGDEQTAAEALRLGVGDYLTKPIDLDALDESLQRMMHRRTQTIYRRKLEKWLRQEVMKKADRRRPYRRGESRASMNEVSALLEAAAMSDEQRERGRRIAALAVRMASQLELAPEEVEQVGIAGLLHELGMVEVAHGGRSRDPSPLRADGKQANRLGIDVLRALGGMGDCVDYVRHHHERLDGSGYPDGLNGDEIQLGAQVVGLAEFFVSLLEGGPSWPALAPSQAVETLRCTSGIWFEKKALDALEVVVSSDGESA